MTDSLEKIFSASPVKIILSMPTSASEYRRVDIERIGDIYHFSMYTEKQVFNKNLGADDAKRECLAMLKGFFRRLNAFADEYEFII